jgi:hypothetical protein
MNRRELWFARNIDSCFSFYLRIRLDVSPSVPSRFDMQAALSALSLPTLPSRVSTETRVFLNGADADARVRQLVRARGALRPSLAVLSLVLVRKRLYEALGFRSLGDYGRERLGIGARSLREWARVWDSLSKLPRLRTAVLRGEVSWSVARRVVAVATPETDAACMETVRGRTVRAVEAMLRAVSLDAEPPDASDADAEDRVRVSLPLESAALPRWAEAVELARRMAGEALPLWECAEAIAAETLATLGPGAMDRDVGVSGVTAAAGAPAGPGASQDEERLSVHAAIVGAGIAADPDESGLLREAFPALCLGAPSPLRPVPDLDALEAWAATASPHDLDAALRNAVRSLQHLDHDLGVLLKEILERRLHHELGFARFDRYVEERVDVSPRTARRWVRLARLGGPGSAVATAFRAGALTEMQALLVAEASTPTTAPAWVRLARQVTLRRLETEVAPPRLSFFAPPEVANVFLFALDAARRHLADAAGRPAPPHRALTWMLEHAIATWLEQGASFEDYADFERDGFRCTAPGCTARRNLHSHHIVFRSAGGPDEPWNRTTLCAFHHQRGIHACLVDCRGRAPDGLVFALGVRPAQPPLLRARSGDVLVVAARADADAEVEVEVEVEVDCSVAPPGV